MQRVFGVTPAQSLASDHPVFNVAGGTNAVGIGFSATKMLDHHWLLNLDSAASWLQRSAGDSPVTEARLQRSLALSINYRW